MGAGVQRGHLDPSGCICPHSPACSGPVGGGSCGLSGARTALGPRWAPKGRPSLQHRFLSEQMAGGGLGLAAGPRRRSWAPGVSAPAPACPGSLRGVPSFSGPGGPVLGEPAEQHPGVLRGCQPGRSELSLGAGLEGGWRSRPCQQGCPDKAGPLTPWAFMFGLPRAKGAALPLAVPWPGSHCPLPCGGARWGWWEPARPGSGSCLTPSRGPWCSREQGQAGRQMVLQEGGPPGPSG